MSLPRLLCTALVSSALLVTRQSGAQPASDQPELPVTIEVTTVAHCPARRFHDELDARMRRPFEVRAASRATLHVAIGPAKAGAGGDLEGHASFAGASGNAERSVRGTCDEITAALALVATTWLEGEPAADPAPKPPPAALPAPAIAPTSLPAESPSAAPLPRKHLSFGAHGISTFGLVGGPAGGAAVSVAYEMERFELRGALRGALGGETIAAGRARYAWLTAGLDGCVHALTGTFVRLAACARLEPGYFRADFAGSARGLPWVTGGAGMRVGWSTGPVRLEIEGFASLPVTGYRVTPTDATIMPFPGLGAAVAAGVMVPFW